MHGLYQVLERMWGGRVKLPVVVRWFVTFHAIVLGWIVFRSQDLAQLGDFLSRFTHGGSMTLMTVPVALAIGLTIGLQLAADRHPAAHPSVVRRAAPAGARHRAWRVLIIVASATISSQGVAPFIYFSF